jgi:hypothetical protein
MRYIQFLHQRYGKEHGIVKVVGLRVRRIIVCADCRNQVVPPKNWAPKLGISFDEFTFTTCEQQIDQLNHRCHRIAIQMELLFFSSLIATTEPPYQRACNRDGANAKFIRKLRCFFQVITSPGLKVRPLSTQTPKVDCRTKVVSLGRSLYCRASTRICTLHTHHHIRSTPTTIYAPRPPVSVTLSF